MAAESSTMAEAMHACVYGKHACAHHDGAELSTMAVTLAGGHGATAARVSSMSGWLVSGDMVGLQTNGKHRCKTRGWACVRWSFHCAQRYMICVRVWIRSPVRIDGSRDWREIERASVDRRPTTVFGRATTVCGPCAARSSRQLIAFTLCVCSEVWRAGMLLRILKGFSRQDLRSRGARSATHK